MTGYSRHIAEKIDWLLTLFPAVVILGARQVGKTTLATTLRPDWEYIDLEKPSDYDIISQDPEDFFTRHPHHVILDEAQQLPIIFQVLRGVIDANRNEKGRFLITGSSSPILLKQVTESLAGRVAILELGTLKASEFSGQPLSTFYELFNSPLNREMLPSGKPPVERNTYEKVWLKGGYPEPCLNEDPAFFSYWMSNYHKTYIERDISELFPRMNRRQYSRFLSMLCHLSGKIINKSDVARALEVSAPTVTEYIDIAEGTYLWRAIKSYEASGVKSLIKMPKGHIRDTGLLHHLCQIHTHDMLIGHPMIGHSFESFVIEEILKGLDASKVASYNALYFRTRAGAEIDLILTGPFGCLPIEIKYGSKVTLRQLRTLSTFVKENNLPFGLLINQGDEAKWVSKEIFQLPAGFL